MIRCRPFAQRAAVLLALAVPLTLTACWLPPKEVIKEKAAARDAWRDQQKENKLAEAEGRAPRAIITVEQVEVLTGRRAPVASESVVATPTMNAPTVATPPAKIEKPMADKPKAAKPKKPKGNSDKIEMAQATPSSGQVVLEPDQTGYARVVQPTSPLAGQADWMQGADAATLARIDGWRSALDRDSAAVVARGDGIAMAKAGRLFDLDAALLYGALPPGLYDCRLFTLNAADAAFAQGESRRCLVRLNQGQRRLSIITIREIPVGVIHDNDAFSSVFLGEGLIAAMAGGGLAEEEAGLVQRVADTRWRLILPGLDGAPTTVVELTRPRPVEGE